MGLRVARFKNDEVINKPPIVIEKITAELNRKSRVSNPALSVSKEERITLRP